MIITFTYCFYTTTRQNLTDGTRNGRLLRYAKNTHEEDQLLKNVTLDDVKGRCQQWSTTVEERSDKQPRRVGCVSRDMTKTKWGICFGLLHDGSRGGKFPDYASTDTFECLCAQE